MATHATTWFGVLSQSAGTLSPGTAVVRDANDEFVVATSANRALYGRSWGVALSAADSSVRSFEYQVAGVLSAELSGIATGSSGDWVIVNASGALERDATPDAGEDVIGRCPHTSGDVQIVPGVWDSSNYAGGGGGGGGGDASYPIDLTDGAEVDVPAAGLISSDGTALASVTTSAGVAALLSDETGTGALVFANTPTLVTPVIGAATGTSLNLSGALTLGTDLSVPNGGTGASSFTSGRLLYGNGASAIAETDSGISTDGTKLSLNTVIEWGSGVGVASHGYNKVAKAAGDWLVARNDAGSGDSTAIAFTADNLWLGADAAGTFRFPTATLNATTVEIYGSTGGGGTGRIKLNASGLHIQDAGGDHFLTLSMPNLAADRTLSIPLLAGNDTMVTEAHVQTLTNKTLTSPSISAAAISGTWTGAATWSSLQTFTADIAQGASPATSGGVRLSNNAAVRALSTGAANQDLIVLNASNQVVVGSLSNVGAVRILAPTGQYIAGLADTHYFQSTGATTWATLTSAAFDIDVAVICKTSAMGALAIDWALGNVFTKTLASGGNTITFSNDADGQTITVVLTSNAGGSTVTWPAAVKWTGGTEPTQTSTGVDVYTLMKAGSTVYGSFVQNFS